MSFWDGTRWVHQGPAGRSSQPRRRARDVLATLVMGLALVGVAYPFAGAWGTSPQASISPPRGLPDSNVTVAGSGFAPRAQLEVIWADVNWGKVRAAADGTVSVQLVVPAAAPGSYVVSLAPRTNGRGADKNLAPNEATVTFEVLAPAAATLAPTPSVTGSTTPMPSATAAATTPTPTASVPASDEVPPTPEQTPIPTATPTPALPSPSPKPTVAPTPVPPPAPAKLLFGVGPEADGAVNLPIVRDAPVRMLTSWYNRPEDLAWMTTWSGAVDGWYAAGYTLHLIVWSGGGSETRFATPYGTACGQAYPMSSRFLDDMRQLAVTFAGVGRVYVTLFTEFQTYPCSNDAWNPNAETNSYYRALKDQYLRAIDVFHAHAPNSRVSLGWGGWQTRWDSPGIGGGRSMFQYFADVMSASDFQSFQAMQSDTNAGDIPAMTSALAPYGPVMLAHYKPDSGNQAVWEADMRAIFTDAFVTDIVRRGLFAFSFMDARNMSASAFSFETTRAAITRYGR